MTRQVWSPDRVEALKRMWDDGKNVKQIAAAMGTTRGSVSGRIDRERLPNRRSPRTLNGIGKRSAALPAAVTEASPPCSPHKVTRRVCTAVSEGGVYRYAEISLARVPGYFEEAEA